MCEGLMWIVEVNPLGVLLFDAGERPDREQFPGMLARFRVIIDIFGSVKVTIIVKRKLATYIVEKLIGP